MAFHTVAIVGVTGQHIGSSLAEGFIGSHEPKYEVHLLVRPSALQDAAKKTAIDAFVKKGAKLVEVDTNDEAALTSAFKGIDLVLSAHGGEGIFGGAELKLIRAAKAAGVKRVVPSGYGGELKPNLHAVFDKKLESIALAKQLGIEYTDVVSNTFLEFQFSAFWFNNLDKEPYSATLVENGNFNSSLVSYHDLGKLLARAIQHPDTKNASIFFSEATVKYSDLIAQFEKVSGKPVAKKNVTLAEAQAEIQKNAGNFMVALGWTTLVEAVKGNADYSAKSFNQKLHPELFKGLHLRSVEEHLKHALHIHHAHH